MPSKLPSTFPVGCIDGVALMGGVEKPLPRFPTGLRFPTIHDWTPDPAVALPPVVFPEEFAEHEIFTKEDIERGWRESLCEEEWNRAVANLELGEWRPDAAWLHFLEGQIRKASLFINLRKRFEAENDFDLLVANVTCIVWQYFWKSNLHNRVDGIFHLAQYFGATDLSEHQQIAINTLWAATRKALGLPQGRKVNKRQYVEPPPATKTANQVALSSDLVAIFRRLPDVNKQRALEWTSSLLSSLRIEEGPIDTIVERLRTRERRSV